MPLNIVLDLGIDHRSIFIWLGTPTTTAHRLCLVVALQGESHLNRFDHGLYQGVHVLLHLFVDGYLLDAFLHGGVGQFHPCTLQLVQVDHHICHHRILFIENHCHPVAYRRTTDDASFLRRIKDIVCNRVAAFSRKEYQNGIGTAITSQSVERGVTFNRGARSYVHLFFINGLLRMTGSYQSYNYADYYDAQ